MLKTFIATCTNNSKHFASLLALFLADERGRLIPITSCSTYYMFLIPSYIEFNRYRIFRVKINNEIKAHFSSSFPMSEVVSCCVASVLGSLLGRRRRTLMIKMRNFINQLLKSD